MGWSCATRLIQTLELSSIIGTRPSQSLKLHPHNLLYIYYSHDRFAPLLHKVWNWSLPLAHVTSGSLPADLLKQWHKANIIENLNLSIGRRKSLTHKCVYNKGPLIQNAKLKFESALWSIMICKFYCRCPNYNITGKKRFVLFAKENELLNFTAKYTS